jgi:hypothetical protein
MQNIVNTKFVHHVNQDLPDIHEPTVMHRVPMLAGYVFNPTWIRAVTLEQRLVLNRILTFVTYTTETYRVHFVSVYKTKNLEDRRCRSNYARK